MRLEQYLSVFVACVVMVNVSFAQDSNLAAADKNGDAKAPATNVSQDKADPTDASKSFQKIGKLIANNNWADVSELMTQKAQDEFVVEQVISSLGLTNMNMQMPIPGLDEAIDEIDNVLIKYGFDQLKIDTSSMFKMKMSMGDEDEEIEDDDGLHGNRDAMAVESKKIINHVNKSGKRWDIVKELWDAKKASPFSMSPLTGKIKKAEAADDEGVAYLEVTMAPAQSDDNSGVMIQMVTPPIVLRMVKDRDNWKLDGRDGEKSAKLMKEFMKNQPGMRAPVERSDF